MNDFDTYRNWTIEVRLICVEKNDDHWHALITMSKIVVGLKFHHRSPKLVSCNVVMVVDGGHGERQ